MFDREQCRILSLTFYPQDGGAMLKHFVLQVGANPQTQEIALSDPFDPANPIMLKVDTATPPDSTDPMVRLGFCGEQRFKGFPDADIFIDGLVCVKPEL
jgi:hypothetical protein